MRIQCERCGRTLCEIVGGVFLVHHHRRKFFARAEYVVFTCEKCGQVQKVMPDGEIAAITTPETTPSG